MFWLSSRSFLVVSNSLSLEAKASGRPIGRANKMAGSRPLGPSVAVIIWLCCLMLSTGILAESRLMREPRLQNNDEDSPFIGWGGEKCVRCYVRLVAEFSLRSELCCAMHRAGAGSSGHTRGSHRTHQTPPH